MTGGELVGRAPRARVNRPAAWFLSASERGNPATLLDRRHPDGASWSTGNDVRALVHGAVYFRELHRAIIAMGPGDLLLFVAWRGDADQLLDGPGTDVGSVLAGAAQRGVDVRGLLWRSHLDRFQFSATENRHLSEVILAAGGQCLLDMRVRLLGSHHQKMVVLRHLGRPERDVAYIGGIDLCHGRRDDHPHDGDLQARPMAATYGPRPPWHDVQLAVQGPAVGDAETVFRERWDDASPLSQNPVHRFGLWWHRLQSRALPLPRQLPDPVSRGTHAVQLLRTYPVRRPRYPFAPDGERSIARGYRKALAQARSIVYVEDQYLWSTQVATEFAAALVRAPQLRLIVVIPRFPELDGRVSAPPNLLGREPAMRLLRSAGGSRVGIYSLENSVGTPVYVHAKVCVIDDVWACVGSDNANRRSWTHDSELSCAVLDEAGPGDEPDGDEPDDPRATTWARALRLELAGEHLGRTGSLADLADLAEPGAAFTAFAAAAAELDDWHRNGQRGPRPRGRLRTYTQEALPALTRVWAHPLYRVVYDPDGRSARMRRTGQY